MNLVEIFKPDVKKVTITTILVVLLFISTFNFYSFSIFGIIFLIPIQFLDYKFYNLPLLQYPQPSQLPAGAGVVSPIGLTLTGWIITALYFYFISLLIVLIYNKIKKSHKNVQ